MGGEWEGNGKGMGGEWEGNGRGMGGEWEGNGRRMEGEWERKQLQTFLNTKKVKDYTGRL